MKLFSLFTLIISFNISAQNPPELGKVKWLRKWDEAVNESKKSGKDIFLLFQEVPGCHTCTTFGHDILSHPLLVEIIEDYFVPLAIYNNIGGHDREVLNRFKERTWNNPVVRIVNNEGKDITSAKGGVYTLDGIFTKITDAMRYRNIVLPKYMLMLQDEFAGLSGEISTTYLSMYCFWTGEKEIAKITGVLSTEAGYMKGNEVVKVKYDKDVTDVSKIAMVANEKKCADSVFDNNLPESISVKVSKEGPYRKDKESKYYLYKSKYRYIPMTSYQAMKVNSLLGQSLDPSHLLSPRQLLIFEETIKKAPTESPDYEDIYTSWQW